MDPARMKMCGSKRETSNHISAIYDTVSGAWTDTAVYVFTGRNSDGAGPKSKPRPFLDPNGAPFFGTAVGRDRPE
jgi:hypothetical protein